MGSNNWKPTLCYVDVGGTFTDAFVVDENGGFIIKKASTTPDDTSRGFFDALEGVAEKLGMTFNELANDLQIIGYGSTTVLNALLTRNNLARIGLIVSKGFEDILLIERGKQSWTDYDRKDRIHVVTHLHLEPLVPKKYIKGVSERITCRGDIAIPLYEHEVEAAVKELIEMDVEAIVISFLWSFLNSAHELRCKEIAEKVIAASGKNVSVTCGIEVSPVIRELPRTNAALIEAATSPLIRKSFETMDTRLKEQGFKGQLQIMQSSGGLAASNKVKAVDTINSGPVGGLIGGRFIGELYGIKNMITTDVGGTSFDVGLINNGNISIMRQPTAARMLLGVPQVEVISVGAGGGTLAYIDPLTGRLAVGPESAGADPGPVCYDKGGEQPTVTDADLILGYLDPDYFAGGNIRANLKRAREAMKQKIAEPLGISVTEAAAGIREITDVLMRQTIAGLVNARGSSEINDYHLLAFGGGGASHVAGYTQGLPLMGVMVFPYSAVFSAFGASTSDYEHHYHRATNLVIPQGADDNTKMENARKLNELWEQLKDQAIHEMVEEGFGTDDIQFRFLAMMRYGRQLNDLIIDSPFERIDTIDQWNELIQTFETTYEQTYAKAAKYPQAGYEIMEVGLVSSVEKIRPTISALEMGSKNPSQSSQKGKREAFFGGVMTPCDIYEMNQLSAGNVIEGPAIIEDPTTTLVLYPNNIAEVDRYSTFWLKEKR